MQLHLIQVSKGAIVLLYRSKKIEKTKFPEDNVTVLEHWIDELDAKLPPFKTFTIPVSLLSGLTTRVLLKEVPHCRCAVQFVVERNEV